MNNVENETGKKESRIKLIRADGLNKGMAYDYRCDGKINTETKSCTGNLIYTDLNYSKNWNESSLQKILNNKYYNQEIAENVFELNYLYNGSSYNWKTDYLDYDFRNRGLSKKTKEYIEPATYYLGNIYLTENEQNLNTKEIYSIERSKQVEDNFPSEWTGNVGLMYLSDYGFTVDDKNTCLNSALYVYSTNGCRGKTWILDKKYNYEHWTIDGHMVKSSSVTFNYSASRYAVTVLPTVYLKSNVQLISGDGSKTNPYKINI